MGRPGGEDFRASNRAELDSVLADHVDRAFEANAIDGDLDQVAVADLAERPSRERLGADVADAGPGRDAREPGVGDHGDVLAERQVLERGGDLIDLLHARPHRAATHQDKHITGLDRSAGGPFDRGDRLALAGKNPRRAGLAVNSVEVDHRWIDGRALDDRSVGGEVADGESHRAGQPALAGLRRSHDHVVGVHSVFVKEPLAQLLAALRDGPGVEHPAERAAGGGEDGLVEQAESSELEHHLGDAPGEVNADGRVVRRAIGQNIHDPRDLDVDLVPVVARRPGEARGKGDRRDVQEQVRGTAERGVNGHRVADGGVGQDVARGQTLRGEVNQGASRASGHLLPDRLSRGDERRVRQGETERLGDDLRRGRGAEELAAPPWTGAGAAAQFGRLLKRQLAVRIPRADRLNLSRVFPHAWGERDAPRHDHSRKVLGSREGQHHGGQALVAGRHAEHAFPPRQRADESAEDDRRVVAEGKAVHHSGRALGPSVARVRHHPGERRDAEGLERLGRLANEQADFPVPGVIAQRDRRAVLGAEAALRAEDQVRVARHLRRRPAHPGVLAQAEEVARGPLLQHGVRQRQRAGGAVRPRADCEDRGIALPEKFLKRRSADRTRDGHGRSSHCGKTWNEEHRLDRRDRPLDRMFSPNQSRNGPGPQPSARTGIRYASGFPP